jgi:transcriptional regulator with XRE-family HTH domain
MNYRDHVTEMEANDPAFREARERSRPQFEFRKALIGARLNAGLTQKQLADRMGSTQPTIARLESGLSTPSLGTLHRLADVLGVDFTISPRVPEKQEERHIGSVITGLTAKQAERITGVSERTLHYWASTGFITRSVGPGSSSGDRKLYSFQDLVALKVAKVLRDQGIPLQGLRKVVQLLRGRGDRVPFTGRYIFGDGYDVYERSDEEVVSLLKQPGQHAFIWVINLGEIEHEVQEAIQQAA